MLKVPSNKTITGYAPCPDCQTPCAVFFPKGGHRKFTPYLCCGQCNTTNQTGEVKAHIMCHYAPTLDSYAAKFAVDVSKEKAQILSNKWTENPQQYDAKINGIDIDKEKKLKATLDAELTEAELIKQAPLAPALPSSDTHTPPADTETANSDSQETADRPADSPLDDHSPDVSLWGASLALAALVMLCYGGYRAYRAIRLKAKESYYE